jgi:erythronate-4-phosphate dehydrogenase
VIKVLADRHIPFLQDYLSSVADLSFYDSDVGFGPELAHADALIIRTVSKVNAQTLLRGLAPNLKFVTSPSAGFDHVDVSYLHSLGITFSSAEGCNAWSVGEYVGAAVLHWAVSKGVRLDGLRVGIVGAGHTGSAVGVHLRNLGCDVVYYDPPRALHDPAFNSASLDEVLACDVLTIHTPLTKAPSASKSETTWHWLDSEILGKNSFKLVINAARGGILDENALVDALRKGSVGDTIIDVWENEPLMHPELLQKAWVATPHIAGYSVQAKQNASRIACKALMRHFRLQEATVKGINSAPGLQIQQIDRTADLIKILEQIHPMFSLSNVLKTSPSGSSKVFSTLRNQTPLRNEFNQLKLPDSVFEQYPILAQLFSEGDRP